MILVFFMKHYLKCNNIQIFAEMKPFSKLKSVAREKRIHSNLVFHNRHSLPKQNYVASHLLNDFSNELKNIFLLINKSFNESLKKVASYYSSREREKEIIHTKREKKKN